MVHHIKASDGTSKQVLTGDAFAENGPDSLIVDVNAFLISENMGDGARLTGDWTVTINGQVTAFAEDAIRLDSVVASVSTVTVGRSGDVTGSNNGITFNEAGTLINKGIISGNNRAVLHLVAADFSLNNSGLIQGGLFGFFAAGCTDIYTVVNGGTISGSADADAVQVSS